jgi:hypothetical protein
MVESLRKYAIMNISKLKETYPELITHMELDGYTVCTFNVLNDKFVLLFPRRNLAVWLHTPMFTVTTPNDRRQKQDCKRD